MIKEFRGQYYFLSNFYTSKVTYKGLSYMNNEAAFQAQKVLDLDGKKAFCTLDAKDAKRQGRRVKLRSDWESVKDNIMYEIVLAKFSQNYTLKEKLLNTGDKILIEGNKWNDTYWGVCNGKGMNKLGTILMKVREELKHNK